MSDQERDVRMGRILKWTARIWSLPAILFSILEVAYPHSDPDITIEWSEWLMVGLMFSSVAGLALAWWKARLGGWFSLGVLFLFFIAYWVFSQKFFPIWHLMLLAIGLPAGIFILSSSFANSAEAKLNLEKDLPVE